MIITKEIILNIGLLNLDHVPGLLKINFPEDYQNVVSQLISNENQMEAKWLEDVKPLIIKSIGNYTFGNYGVLNSANAYEEYDTLEAAQAQIETNKQSYITTNMKDLFSVHKITKNSDNTTTWTKIDISVLPTLPNATYTFYNTLTGTHDEFNTTNDTVNALQILENNIKNQLTSIHYALMRKIISSDGKESGWLPV